MSHFTRFLPLPPTACKETLVAPPRALPVLRQAAQGCRNLIAEVGNWPGKEGSGAAHRQPDMAAAVNVPMD